MSKRNQKTTSHVTKPENVTFARRKISQKSMPWMMDLVVKKIKASCNYAQGFKET